MLSLFLVFASSGMILPIKARKALRKDIIIKHLLT